MNAELTTLPNGIRVVTCEMPHTQSVTFGLWASVGGRHEPAPLNGISHFIEHMLFKGTQRRTARRIGEEVESVGGYLNASTTHDHTAYYGAAPADHFNRLSAVLCDMYLSPRFAERDISKERAVIAEEILMYQDEPSDLVQEVLWEELWPGHGLGRPLTGTLDSIKRLGRSEFLNFREQHYTGANTVVSAAGKLRHEKVVERVERLLGDLPSGRRTASTKAPELTRTPRVRVVGKETQQTHLAFAVPGSTLHDEARYPTSLINVILGGNMSSRLFQQLRESRGLCYNVSSNVSHYEDAGVINFYLGLDERNIEKSLALILHEFENLREKLVSPSELKRAKEYAIGSSRMSLERSSAQNSRVGYSVMFYGEVIDPDVVHARLRAVTAEEIRDIARSTLLPERMTVTIVGPAKAAAIERLLA